MSHDQRRLLGILLLALAGVGLIALGVALELHGGHVSVAVAQEGTDEPEADAPQPTEEPDVTVEPAATEELSAEEPPEAAAEEAEAASEAAATQEVAPADDTVDNSYCAICHSQPGRVMTLDDGSVLDLYVSPATIADSVHGMHSDIGPLGCVDCHGENIFPHSGPSPESARAYRIEAAQLCSNCHNELLADSAHLEAIAQGNLHAATCVDCHGAHDVPATEDQPTLVAAVCGDCHTESYREWAESPHSDMASLGCAVCHLPHGQQMRIGDTTDLCLNCHQVPGDIYVHATHLESEFDVSCASCHMAVDPGQQLASNDGESSEDNTGDNEMEPTDHRMIVQTRSCNTCHEELEQSGIWTELAGSEENLVIERDALRQQIANLEEEASSSETANDETGIDYVQLIQGLIVGLGVGLVFALVLIPKLNRNNRNELLIEDDIADEPHDERE